MLNCLENVCESIQNTYNEGAKYGFEGHTDKDWKLYNKTARETWTGVDDSCIGNQVRKREIEQTTSRKAGCQITIETVIVLRLYNS